MSKDENNIKEFVEKNCKLFTLIISSNKHYFISFHPINDQNIKELFDFLFEGEKDFELSNEDEEEKNLVLIKGLPQIQMMKKDKNERDIIYKICSKIFAGKLLLINDTEGNFYFTYDINEIKKNDSKEVFGVCLFDNTEINIFDLKKISFSLLKEEAVSGEDIYSTLIKEYLNLLEEEKEEEIKKEINNEEYEEENSESNLNKKRNRNKKSKISEKKVREITQSFISKLNESVELDKQNRRKNKPSLNKLKLLPSISNFLSNIYYQKEFLSQNGLETLQEWLIRNPDGTFPPLNQIRTMLDNLNNINIKTKDLSNCQIGGCVMDLSKNKNFPNDIQRKAKNLIEKWLRTIYNINIDYSDFESSNQKYIELIKKNKGSDEDNSNNEDDEDEDNKDKVMDDIEMKNDIFKENEIYNMSRVPKKGLFDFIKKPISKFDKSKVDDNVKNFNFDFKRFRRGKNK